VGTVSYMAPEQVRGETVDERSDWFALGVVLYELAVGRRPFLGASLAETTSAILRDDPPPLASLRTDLPPDLERIVGRCLEKDPERRAELSIDMVRRVLGAMRPYVDRRMMGALKQAGLE
jgi:eukaryotic-like serine/threonine-protein kinase